MLYKYRGVAAFRYLADIFVKSRLYAACYDELNDPMEGMYITSEAGDIDEDMRKLLYDRKQHLRICSLAKKPDNLLMWSHYAEGHRGIVIGVEVKDYNSETREVIYNGPMQLSPRNINQKTPEDILCYKLLAWAYEEEVRVFVNNKKYVSVQLGEVIIGSRMSNQEKSFLREFLDRVCPGIPVKNSRLE